MTTIARAYETEQQARDACDALVAQGVFKERIQIILPDSAASTASEGLRAGKALSLHNNAESFAKALESGNTVVLADTHFGTGLAMSKIMDSFNPVALEPVSDVEDPYHPGTPFSYTMGMPTLIRNSPAPFSKTFGFSIESKGRSAFRRWFGGELGSSATPLSNMMGMPTLTSGSNSFFSRFGFPELSNESTERSSSFGLPLLMDEAAPFSGKIEMQCLSDEPAPLSSKLGMSVLSGEKDRTPTPPPPPIDG